MYKKVIKYKNFNDEERERTAYFNLTKAEVIQLEASKKGGMGAYLNSIIEEQDTPKIADQFIDLIKLSYGVKSSDGESFIKTSENLNEFMQSAAFSEFYVSLATDAKAAADFVNGILPSEYRNLQDVPKIAESTKNEENKDAMNGINLVTKE